MEHLVAVHLTQQKRNDGVALWRVAPASDAAAGAEGHDAASVTWTALCRWLDGVRDALQQPSNAVDMANEPAARTIGIACAPCSVEETALVLTIAREANWSYVPIDVSLPVARQVQMLQNANADTLITVSASRIASFLVDNPELLAAGAEAASCKTIAADSAGFFWSLQVFSFAPSRRSPPSGAAQGSSKKGPLYVLFTSGSTGTPKGVVGTGEGALGRLQWMWETYPFDAEKECVVRVTKLSFVDSVSEILGSLLKAVPLVHIEREPRKEGGRSLSPLGHVILDNSDAFLHVMQCFHVTRFTTIPSILEMLLLSKHAPRLCRAFASLRYVLASGEIFPVRLAMRATTALPHVTFLNLFGSTEVSGDVTWFEIHAPLAVDDVATWKEHGVPIGRVGHVIGNTTMQLVDSETRVEISTAKQKPEPMPQMHGELFVAGDSVALGYVQRDSNFEGDTAAQANVGLLDQQGWFHTGDWCKVVDKNLHLCGRTDSRVKTRGHRVHLEAVERVVEAALADVSNGNDNGHVVVLAIKDPSVHQLSSLGLVAFILLAEDHPAAAATTIVESYSRKHALFERINATHGSVFVPRDVILVPPSAVTRVPNGKLDKSALEAMFYSMKSGENTTGNLDMATEATPAVATTSRSIEDFVRQQVETILGVKFAAPSELEKVRNYTFQEFGGNSLSATLLSWELQQRFQCSIRPHDLVPRTLDSIVNQVKLTRAQNTCGKRENCEEIGHRSATTAASSSEPHFKRLKAVFASYDSASNAQDKPVERRAIETLSRCNQSTLGSGRAYLPRIACARSSTRTRSPSHPCTPELAWQVDLGKCIDASPLVIRRGVASTSADAHAITASTWAVIGSHSSRLVCVDVHDQGRIVWQQQLDDRIEASVAASLAFRLVYVGTYSGSLYAMEVETGAVRWRFRAQDAVKASVLVIDALQLAVCGTYDHRVYGLDAATGVEKWRLNVNGSVFSTPVLIDNTLQQQLCIASTSGYLCCVSLRQDSRKGVTSATPQLVWTRQLPAPIFSSLSADAAQQVLLVGCADGNLYAFDTATGASRWQFPTQKPIFSSPTVYDNVVVFGSHDGHLRKVDTRDGKLIWATKLGQNAIFGSPALFARVTTPSGAAAAKDFAPENVTRCPVVVCVPTISGTLFFCDEDTGVVLHALDHTLSASGADGSGRKPLGELFSSPVVVDGVCLIGSRSNQLLAFRICSLVERLEATD